MRELEAAQQIHLSQVSEAEFVAQAGDDNFKDDIGRQFEIVEGSAGTLVASAVALDTVEYCVAEVGTAVQIADLGRLAMRANHRHRCSTPDYRTLYHFPLRVLTPDSLQTASWPLSTLSPSPSLARRKQRRH